MRARSSFPEAEVTSSLANLLKANWVNFEEESFVIDNASLSEDRARAALEQDQARRYAATGEGYGAEYEEGYEGGFTAGLGGMSVDPDDASILPEASYEGMEYAEDGEGYYEDASPEQLEQLTSPQAAPPPPHVPQIDEEALQAQVDEIINNAQVQADQILAEARSEADQMKQNAIEQGLQEGHDEGYSQGLQEVEDLKAQLALQKEEQDREYKKLTDAIEPDMVDVLTQIYEHVFAVDFKGNKNIILHLVKSTLSHIEGNSNLIVHVSSDDYDMIIDEKEHLQEMVTNPNVLMEIVEDPLLKEDECTIETENGVFDCSVGTELEELSRKLKLLSFERR